MGKNSAQNQYTVLGESDIQYFCYIAGSFWSTSTVNKLKMHVQDPFGSDE